MRHKHLFSANEILIYIEAIAINISPRIYHLGIPIYRDFVKVQLLYIGNKGNKTTELMYGSLIRNCYLEASTNYGGPGCNKLDVSIIVWMQVLLRIKHQRHWKMVHLIKAVNVTSLKYE